MKKEMMLCLIPMLLLTSCGYDNEINLGIGDGAKVEDAVRIYLNFNNVWEVQKDVLFINYGHEKNAVLQDEYKLAISKTDPIFNNNVELKIIYSFTKEMVEPNTISNDKLNTQGKYNSIKFDNFNFFDKTESNEIKKFYFVFYNNNSDFKNITTYNTSEISYSFDGNKVVVNK